jgi:cyclase
LLAKRIVPTLLLSGGTLVKDVGFSKERVVGNPVQTAKVYGLREVDEIVIFDVSARDEFRPPDFATIERMCGSCFLPTTVGGGIRDVSDAKKLIRECGADKIALGSRSWHLAKPLGNLIGRQSVVGVLSGRGDYEPHLENFGEIIVQSRGIDGTMGGYDVALVRKTVMSVDVPVVASSGCGSFSDMDAVLSVGADAVAAGALWQFTQNTPIEAKEYLEGKGWSVRIP